MMKAGVESEAPRRFSSQITKAAAAVAAAARKTHFRADFLLLGCFAVETPLGSESRRLAA